MTRYRARDVRCLMARQRHAETCAEWKALPIEMSEPLSREELIRQKEGLEATARDLALRVAVWGEPGPLPNLRISAPNWLSSSAT